MTKNKLQTLGMDLIATGTALLSEYHETSGGLALDMNDCITLQLAECLETSSKNKFLQAFIITLADENLNLLELTEVLNTINTIKDKRK